MKVLPTYYRGYHFRSRLEARWAVFFDALSLRFEYEPEGYKLASGECYLPDFFVPDFSGGFFCEVKYIGGDFSKARRFASEKQVDLLECEGTPDLRTFTLQKYEKSNRGWIDTGKGVEGFCCAYKVFIDPSRQRFFFDPEPQVDPYHWPDALIYAVEKSRHERFGT